MLIIFQRVLKRVFKVKQCHNCGKWTRLTHIIGGMNMFLPSSGCFLPHSSHPSISSSLLLSLIFSPSFGKVRRICNKSVYCEFFCDNSSSLLFLGTHLLEHTKQLRIAQTSWQPPKCQLYHYRCESRHLAQRAIV